MPSQKLLANMRKLNEELMTGVLLAIEGLHTRGQGSRVRSFWQRRMVTPKLSPPRNGKELRRNVAALES